MLDTPKIIRSSTRRIRTTRNTSRVWISKTSTATAASYRCGSRSQWQLEMPPFEPRLMVAREPDEYGGTYYRMLPEGKMRDYDGFTIKVNKDKRGWTSTAISPAAGVGSSRAVWRRGRIRRVSEVRAVVHFITHHNNICGGLSFHTWSGVLLRPFGSQSDDEMPAEDLWVSKSRASAAPILRATQHQRIPRIPLPPEGRDQRHLRLDLRAPRPVRVDHRNLVPDARGRHHGLQVHRLVPRPSGGRRPEDAPMGRQGIERPRLRELVHVQASAVG